MTLKNVVASSLVIALGVILIVHFAMFWIYGGVFIYENNRIILAVETVMSIAILSFGIERLVSSASEKTRQVIPVMSTNKAQRQASFRPAAISSFIQTSRDVSLRPNHVRPMMPGATTMLTENIPDYIEKYHYEMSNSTQTASDILIHISDEEP